MGLHPKSIKKINVTKEIKFERRIKMSFTGGLRFSISKKKTNGLTKQNQQQKLKSDPILQGSYRQC